MNPARWPASGQLLLAFGAGSVTVLGFAPFGLGLLSPLTLAVLFFLWRHPARRGLNIWTGYAFGLGLMGFGVFWIRISIAQFGGVTPPLAVAITLLFVISMAAYFALAGWLGQRIRPRSEAIWLVGVLPAVWILVEWLRGWLFTGFPWLALGYSQIDLPLAGYAPAFGVHGSSLVVAVSAGLINLWWCPATAASDKGHAARLAAPIVLLLMWAAGWGLQQLQWSRPAAAPIRVSLLQGNIPQRQKWQRSMRVPTLNLYLDMTAAVPDSRIVIWPETAVPAFASEVETSLLKPLDELMREQGRDVLLGVVDGDQDGDYYNAMLSLGASGRDHYHKRHLVPFGEYLPFDRWTRPVLDFLRIPMSDFAPGGNGKPLLTLAGQPVGIDICYEDAYAVEILRALPEATLLINASNDAWFGDSLAPHQHLEIARMRALETGRYLLRATNTGISAIIDQHGQLLGTSPQFEKVTLSDEVVPLQGATPFVRWGNTAVVAVAGLILLFGLWRHRVAG
jgi:apolipoprotein N-acyltransferase